MAGQMPKRVDAQTPSGWERVASAVRSELAAAGLQVVVPGLAPKLAVGADVTIDPIDAAAGGVFIEWRASLQLTACAVTALRHERTNDPALRHNGVVQEAMAQAAALILSSAGFSVKDAEDEHRPFALKVTAGPGDDVVTSWATRADGLALPGWAPTQGPHPGSSWPHRQTPGPPAWTKRRTDRGYSQLGTLGTCRLRSLP